MEGKLATFVLCRPHPLRPAQFQESNSCFQRLDDINLSQVHHR